MALATWRLVLAPALAVLAYVLSKPVMEVLLGALRKRVARGFRYVSIPFAFPVCQRGARTGVRRTRARLEMGCDVAFVSGRGGI